MGVVYEAQDTRRFVAVKFLTPALSNDVDALDPYHKRRLEQMRLRL